MKKIKFLILLTLLISLLTGCYDSTDINTIVFPNSISIDYQDGQYHIYMQIVNNNTISRSEIETSTNQAQYIVVDGEGKTITESLNKIEKRLRSEVGYNNINNFILMEGMLKESKQLNDFFKFVLNTPAIKLNSYLFYSELDPKEIYKVRYQVADSNYYALINSTQTEEFSPIITPNTLLDGLKKYYNKHCTLRIPVIDLYKNGDVSIQHENSEYLLYNIDSNVFLQHDYHVSLDNEKLIGLQWVLQKNKRIQESIVLEDNYIVFTSGKSKAKFSYNKKSKTYKLLLKLDIYVNRTLLDTSVEDCLPIIKDFIEEKIMESYLYGIKNNADIFDMQPYSSLFSKESENLTKDNFKLKIEINPQIKGYYLDPVKQLIE